METEELRLIVENAVARLQTHDGILLKNDINERTLTHRLAIYIECGIRNWENEKVPVDRWHVDCEYNRQVDEEAKNNVAPKRLEISPLKEFLKQRNCHNEPSDSPEPGTVYPDIIVHKRNEKVHNLLAIEVKKQSTKKPSEKDLLLVEYDCEQKLRGYSEHLGYQHVLFICLRTGDFWQEEPNLNWQPFQR